MVIVRHSLAILLCLVSVPNLTTAFLKKNPKRLGVKSSSGRAVPPTNKLSFTDDEFPSETIGTKYGSVVLECAARGTPSPTIHWLKDGQRLEQDSSYTISDDEASFEDPTTVDGKPTLKLSVTHSRLFLDCLGDDDAASYTCVAENPKLRISQSTNLRLESSENSLFSEVPNCIEKKSNRGEPARIYMWTVSRLEFENNVVQLFCRAEGFPEPSITWYDRDKNPIENNDYYRIASNGDLVIRDVTWLDNMGVYTCVAENRHGVDTTETFVYPTKR